MKFHLSLSLLAWCTSALVLFAASCTTKTTEQAPETQTWTSLFDGTSLEGWTPKISGHPLGDNFANTFRVSDSTIQVGYEGYENFDSKFGHLFYAVPYGSYKFRMEYRFTGEQAPGGANWAFRNSGIMVHCQDPKTMMVEQDFPVCIEVQLLGGPEEGDRPTGNLCTPGTHVVLKDSVFTDHCIPSTSATYRGDQWVAVQVEVFADSLIRHIIEGDTVMTYYRPQIGGGGASPVYAELPSAGTPLREGWISLQSESHPVEFRHIELLEL